MRVILRRLLYTVACKLLLSLFLMGSLPAIANASDDPKLLLIHLDAVSMQVLEEQVKAGNLPNIEKHFWDRGGVEKALTYYPSKTPFVISNIRSATPSSEGPLVGWKIPDYAGDASLELVDSFLLMALSKHRIARGNLIHGLPLTNRLNRYSLMNTIDLFDDYPVIEFYWYPVDTYGHFYGKEEYLRKLREFDSAIGKFISKVGDDVNIIIYSDHGMVFGDGYRVEETLVEKYSDLIKTFSYPSIYLNEGVDKDEAAREFVNESELKFAFYRENESTVVGYSDNSKIRFSYRDNMVRYTYEGEDVFEYYSNGYGGEYKSADEWLLFSIDLDYPAIPIKVFTFLQNPNSGDIVTSLDNNSFVKSGYSRMGNHGGFTATELVVPVMVKGPRVDYIGDFEVLWLQDLFNEIQDFEFKSNPSREKHYLSGRYDFRSERTVSTISLSPTYRINFGADISFDRDINTDLETVWGRYDIYRSYLARLWFGGGVDFRKEDTVGMLFLKHEIRIRQFTARSELNTSGLHRFTIGYAIHPNINAELTNFKGLGLRISF